jgi:hypothetical protein
MFALRNGNIIRITQTRLFVKIILAALLMIYLALVTGCGSMLNSMCGGTPTRWAAGDPDEGRTEEVRPATPPETEN